MGLAPHGAGRRTRRAFGPFSRRRLHSTLGYISPMKFEEDWHAGQSKKAA
jgi:hypothetical protein